MDNVVAEYLTKAHGAPPDGGWREYEDPEWFALAIEKDWQFVAKMVAAGDANAAARFSVRLGWKLAILLSKLGVEDDWQWGRDKRAASSGGGSKGGEATDPDNDAGVAVMAEVLPGLTGHGRISKAARIAAKQIGKPTKAGAIRAAYNRRRRKLDAS
jgi:hypothetical protein